MKLHIRHETVYRFTAPSTYIIQQLRLTPRRDAHQRILSWQLQAPGRQHEFLDACGNLCHILTITERHDEVRIVAAGSVDVAPLERGRLADPGGLSPLVFTVPGRLTAADPEVAAFASRHLRPGAGSSDLLALAEAIRASVVYRNGATEVTTPASDALRLGEGVCQDHAHLFIACCHVHGIPARYVSGYIDPGDTSHAASHAWADAWVEDVDFSGWVSIDVTHACFAGESHCRLAIGRDYDSASPVRGVRHGGGSETLDVHVEVSSKRA
ncbi:MAG TPA: transglutaminase family protein [Noviherbaspirillum sp.]|uniref:transglutaminase family protein n=1 Tax=Noviherbaspirillum sp. TaxID=1926288 RepID=UPI002D22AB3B|nr:transglutaminase family protein [Noviherbaspirillum sp.]HYD94430.1 transglutaminase family protein [Noviherbaspirillum sp.]